MGTFNPGERVLLIDGRGRRYLVRLDAGGSFQSHAGVVDFDAVIGADEGSEIVVRRREGAPGEPRRFLAFRPTLSDLVLKMPRGAQVIYPKDLGAILISADLYPGARVFETGVGSGALSIAALRAGCDVVGYELRPDFANRARHNVEAAIGSLEHYRVEERNSYEGVEPEGFDRALLDLPEPWQVVPHLTEALSPGGVLCAYLPSINQSAQLRSVLSRHGFVLAETFEVLHRSWHIEGRSVRPDHRMVAHTGFLTTARLAGKGAHFDVEPLGGKATSGAASGWSEQDDGPDDDEQEDLPAEGR